MLRLFVGLSIPPDICRHLTLMQGGIPGARWTARDDHHLTLCFIGDTDEAAAEDMHDILSRLALPAFSLSLSGVHTFDYGNKPRVVWAGVRASEPLMHLQSKISTALLQRHFPVDTRKFTPHVTLAHLKNADLIKLGDFISAYSLFETASFTVPAFHLYHSRRGSDAGRYEILSSYDLS